MAIYYFKKMHTKQLLKLLRQSYRYADANGIVWNENVFHGDMSREDPMAIDYTIDELKAELATRPHVPNKIESRKIRQDNEKFR